ncbi:2'-5' RNA ligase family protein [Sporohalobacter salinus]|uniref:2'-5' RNA ligase family protein n=1 Tax=Sporohalobacter salinus TaxID=1494606 RepID=UPI00195F4FEA|nr:2'-5' RNA ligase family protein [Sporohalobacter salinus]MBM7623618.1 2'-5' RNA ligase [Sporohalobacter salinus]
MELDELEEVFVVLTLPKKSLKPLLKFRRKIAKKYNLYPDGNYPELHITLNRIKDDSVDTGIEIVNNLANLTEEVRISIENFKCFNVKDDFLVLEVNKTESLVKLADKLNEKLTKKGISTIDNYDEWQFHITLISNLFAKNPIPKSNLNNLCVALDGFPQSIYTQTKAIEIWKPTLDPDEKVITSIKL